MTPVSGSVAGNDTTYYYIQCSATKCLEKTFSVTYSESNTKQKKANIQLEGISIMERVIVYIQQKK